MSDQVEDFDDLTPPEPATGGGIPESAQRAKATLPDGRVLVMRRLGVQQARQIAIQVSKAHSDGSEDEIVVDEMVKASLVQVGEHSITDMHSEQLVAKLGRFYNLAVSLYARLNMTSAEETATFLDSIEAA